VNHCDHQGTTALHAASLQGHKDAVEQLLGRGADVDAKTAHGWTPLHFAASVGEKQVVKLLLEKGADVSNTSMTRDTPLSVATQKGHVSVVGMLQQVSRGILVASFGLAVSVLGACGWHHSCVCDDCQEYECCRAGLHDGLALTITKTIARPSYGQLHLGRQAAGSAVRGPIMTHLTWERSG